MERTLYWSARLVSLIKYFYLTTEWLTPLSRVLPKKLTGPQVVKTFPIFYGSYRFITVCTTARHLFLCWGISIQSMSPTYFLKILFNSILPSMLRSQSGPFPSSFLTKTPYERFLSSCTCYMPRLSHSWFNIWWAVQVIRLFNVQSLQSPVIITVLGMKLRPKFN